MRLHRFYIPPPTKLVHDLWLHDESLLHQWNKVLRMVPGQEIVLFNGLDHDRLYRLEVLSKGDAHLIHVTDLVRSLPQRDVYLFWSLLKRDKNDWVLQKCTELGVKHFIPILADRCERTDLSHNRVERWSKIVIEAAEQCGRSDIPSLREPITILTAINEYSHDMEICVADQLEDEAQAEFSHKPGGILIGPEGGWSDQEKQVFKQNHIARFNLGKFTLRAETAAVTAAAKLLEPIPK